MDWDAGSGIRFHLKIFPNRQLQLKIVDNSVNLEVVMDYATLTLSELRSYAKAKGIKGISTLRKDKLIEKGFSIDQGF